MALRIVKQPVNVWRGGKMVAPEVGTTFDFTDAELKDIMKLNEEAIGFILTVDEPSEAAPVAAAKAK
jgi:hypothetical protein